jgi:hypothetical protein
MGRSAMRMASSPGGCGHLTHVCTHAMNSACRVVDVPGGNAWDRGPPGPVFEQTVAPQQVCPDLKKK